MICCLGYFTHEMLHAFDRGTVSGDRDSFRAWREVRKRIEGSDGCLTGSRFARCNVDLGGAGLEEAVLGVLIKGLKRGEDGL
jgi:hypothetical protein